MNILNQYIEYIKDNPNKLWFKAKLFGWGWTPATWQGWTVILVYIIAVFHLSKRLDETDTNAPRNFILHVAILTVMLILIAYKTGEKPRWNWGFPKKKK